MKEKSLLFLMTIFKVYKNMSIFVTNIHEKAELWYNLYRKWKEEKYEQAIIILFNNISFILFYK